VLTAAVIVGLILLFERDVRPSDGFDWTFTVFLGISFAALIAFALGELVAFFRLPPLSGYLVMGLLLGPAVASLLSDFWSLTPFQDSILSTSNLEQLSLLNALALAVIMTALGAELRVKNLRNDLKVIGSFVVGQGFLILILGVGTVWVLGGPLGSVTLPPLVGLSTGSVLGMGILLASIALVTSPAATLAVTHSSEAEGPMTTTVLSVVAVKNLVASLVFTVVGALLLFRLHASEGASAAAQLSQFGGALVGGALLGAALGAYLRYAGDELGLVVLFAIYVTTLGAERLNLDIFPLFLTAGFIAANFSPNGAKLTNKLKRYGIPAYVVFFTFAGAGLNVGALARLAPFALAFAVLRAAFLWIGTRSASKTTAVDPSTQRLGWLGFISQAGLALVLARSLGANFGEAGQTLEALAAGALSINLIVGPVLFRLALGIAGELTPSTTLRDEDVSLPPGWEAKGDQPWGPPPSTSSPELNGVLEELEADLQQLARDVSQDALEPFRNEGETYFKELRRAFLRFHRRAMSAVRSEVPTPELTSIFRREIRELAEDCRGVVLDRSARLSSSGFSPEKILVAIDRLTDLQPILRRSIQRFASAEPGPPGASWKADTVHAPGHATPGSEDRLL
jgi:Kef-type K+ transport system membrane component KefB